MGAKSIELGAREGGESYPLGWRAAAWGWMEIAGGRGGRVAPGVLRQRRQVAIPWGWRFDLFPGDLIYFPRGTRSPAQLSASAGSAQGGGCKKKRYVRDNTDLGPERLFVGKGGLNNTSLPGRRQPG